MNKETLEANLERIHHNAALQGELYMLLALYDGTMTLAPAPLRTATVESEGKQRAMTLKEAVPLIESEDLLVRLYFTGEEELIEPLAAHPYSNACILADLRDIHSGDESLMVTLASNPNLSEDDLIELAADERFAVSLAALDNMNLPEEHVHEHARRWQTEELTESQAEQLRNVVFGLVGGDTT